MFGMDVIGSEQGTALGQLILLLATVVGTIASIWKSGQNSKASLAASELSGRHQLEMIKLQHDNDVADRREKAAQDREDRNLLAMKVADTQSALRQRVDDNAEVLKQRVEATANDVRQRVDDNAEHVRVRLNQAEVTVKQEATEVRQRLDRAERNAAEEAVSIRKRLEDAAALRESQYSKQISDLGTTVEAVEQAGTLAKEALDSQTDTLQDAIKNAMNFTADKADAAYHEANSVNIKIEKLHKTNEEQALVLKRLLAHLIPAEGGKPGAAPSPIEFDKKPETEVKNEPT